MTDLNTKFLKPRYIYRSKLHHPESKDLIDDAMMTFFQQPASFTGEDVVEFHVHGSPAIVDAMLEALASIPGNRMALAGEFSRRALINGKLSLPQVEAIADLIDSETKNQKSLALWQLQVSYERKYS